MDARLAGVRMTASCFPANLGIPEIHAPNGGSTPGRRPVFGQTVLENGIRVVTETMEGVRSVAVGVIVDCGPKDETPEEVGLAHLCEHLLFQGTSGRDANEIARQIDGFGHAGGYTTHDYTCYYSVTLDDYQYHALDLLGDVLLNSTFPIQYLQHEKQAILSEIERRGDVPELYIHDVAMRQAWRGTTLGRTIAGAAEAVTRHTREDAIYFLQRHYTPDKIVIAAAGHLDHEDFVAQARDAFWRLMGHRDTSAPELPAFHSGVTVEQMDTTQAYFCLLIPAPPYVHPDRYVAHVLNRILGGGISSRLSRELRGQTGLVYDIQSEYRAYQNAGMITVEGSSSAASLPRVVRIVLGTIAGLVSGRSPVETEELWRSKTQIRVQHLTSSEDTYTRMCRLATQELYLGRCQDAGEVLARIEAVDLNEITRFIQSYLADFLQAHLVVGGRLPEESDIRAQLTDSIHEFTRDQGPQRHDRERSN